jgi:hypothetical protein
LGLWGWIIVCEGSREGGWKGCGPNLQVSLHVVHAGRESHIFFRKLSAGQKSIAIDSRLAPKTSI